MGEIAPTGDAGGAQVAPAPAAPKKEEKPGETVSKAAAIILVLALGAHAFFEGIAFGVQTEVTTAGQLAAGIIIHKSAAAVSLGGAFARSGFSLKEIILLLALFSILAPIGIAIGMSISEESMFVSVLFMSISGGTFIYVACSEIIVAEFDKGKYQWLKMLLTFIGGALITCLWFFHGHDHGEEPVLAGATTCAPVVDAHAGHDHLL